MFVFNRSEFIFFTKEKYFSFSTLTFKVRLKKYLDTHKIQ